MASFTDHFPPSGKRAEGQPIPMPWRAREPAADLLRTWAGTSFADGVYRVHTARSSARVISAIDVAYPEFAGRWTAFGFDWLGRQFAYRADAAADVAPVTMFEPGTGSALSIPATVWQFHHELLAAEREAVLAASFFQEWMAAGGRPLEHGEVAGYKVPLFLGGLDETANLEVADLGFYWHMSAQLIQQVRDLPPGTRIGRVSGG